MGKLFWSRFRRALLSTSTVLAAGLGFAGVIGLTKDVIGLPKDFITGTFAWPFYALGIVAAGLLALRAWSEYRQQTYDPKWISSMFWNEFDSESTKAARCLAAKTLRAYEGEKLRLALATKDPYLEHPALTNIDDALDFFEDLGFYVEGDQISPEVAHQAFFYWIEGYYLASKEYIEFCQKTSKTAWDHFKPLYEVTSEVEATKVKDRQDLNEAELRRFLDGEIALDA
jgi:hypothetical protein